MRTREPRDNSRNFEYPGQTKANELAVRIRKEANALTEDERNGLLKRGMQIIHGGPGTRATVRTEGGTPPR